MRGRANETGHALILVLILLAVGTLTIAPGLDYVATGLNAQQTTEHCLSLQDDADGALQDAIWQIENAGILVQVNEVGTYAYDMQLDLGRWDIDITIPSFGSSDWQIIRQNNRCKIEVEPNWMGAELQQDQAIYYIVRLDMVQWDMNEFSFVLPWGLTYSNLSAVCCGPESKSSIGTNAEVNVYAEPPEYWRTKDPAGWTAMTGGRFVEVDVMPDPPLPDTWYLLKEWQDGRQKLTWRPDFSATGNDTFILVFQAIGTLGFGIYSIAPVFGDGVETIALESTAAVAAAMYNVTLETSGQTVLAVFGVTDDGVKLISYEVVT